LDTLEFQRTLRTLRALALEKRTKAELAAGCRKYRKHEPNENTEQEKRSRPTDSALPTKTTGRHRNRKHSASPRTPPKTRADETRARGIPREHRHRVIVVAVVGY
jgi:hypothetical protein